jgi:hypothetical protein
MFYTEFTSTSYILQETAENHYLRFRKERLYGILRTFVFPIFHLFLES